VPPHRIDFLNRRGISYAAADVLARATHSFESHLSRNALKCKKLSPASLELGP
jgi:hypothetical protein